MLSDWRERIVHWTVYAFVTDQRVSVIAKVVRMKSPGKLHGSGTLAEQLSRCLHQAQATYHLPQPFVTTAPCTGARTS